MSVLETNTSQCFGSVKIGKRPQTWNVYTSARPGDHSSNFLLSPLTCSVTAKSEICNRCTTEIIRPLLYPTAVQK